MPSDGQITSIRVGEATLEGPEEELLGELVRELARSDPDLLLTDGGDGFDLPWLYRRAAAGGRRGSNSVGPGARLVPAGPSRAIVQSYGRVEHRAACVSPARTVPRRSGEFVPLRRYLRRWLESTQRGSRASRSRPSSVNRQGTCFTAMEMAHARAEGIHIPWKKTDQEEFKSGTRLVEADRGGVIFLPPVGVHDHVDEFDFASLYPHIMVRKNLSTETLECRCCPNSPTVAPGLGYRSCVPSGGSDPSNACPATRPPARVQSGGETSGSCSRRNARACSIA